MEGSPTTLIGIVAVLIALVGAVVHWFMKRLDKKDDVIEAKDKKILQLIDTFTETVNHKQTAMTEALHKLNEGIEYLTNIWKNGK